MAITFIQYEPPNGRFKTVTIVRPDHVERKASEIEELGYRFEIELLSTGHASITIGDDDADYAHVIVTNGPGVPEAVDRLIMDFQPVSAEARAWANKKEVEE